MKQNRLTKVNQINDLKQISLCILANLMETNKLLNFKKNNITYKNLIGIMHHIDINELKFLSSLENMNKFINIMYGMNLSNINFIVIEKDLSFLKTKEVIERYFQTNINDFNINRAYNFYATDIKTVIDIFSQSNDDLTKLNFKNILFNEKSIVLFINMS